MIGFFPDQSDRSPVFVLNSVLMIPKVAVQPNLEEVQDVLNLAGKNITSVSKGVGQWTGGRPQVSLPVSCQIDGSISLSLLLSAM
jgi:dynein heavy chain